MRSMFTILATTIYSYKQCFCLCLSAPQECVVYSRACFDQYPDVDLETDNAYINNCLFYLIEVDFSMEANR